MVAVLCGGTCTYILSNTMVCVLVLYMSLSYHTEDDWEATHLSKIAGESHDHSLPLHHDDSIIKAMAIQQNPVPSGEGEEIHYYCPILLHVFNSYMKVQ